MVAVSRNGWDRSIKRGQSFHTSRRHLYGCILRLTLSCTSLDEQDISVFHHIILPFRHYLTLGLHRCFVTFLLERVVVVHHSLDESLLEVAVNHTGGLRCLGAVSYRPLPDFVGSGCEEGAQVECFPHGCDDLRERRLRADLLEFGFSLGLGLESCQTLLERDTDQDHGVAGSMLFYPFGDLGEMLVAAADVVFLAEVDEVDDWLGCEEEEWVDDFDLCFEYQRTA